MIRYVSAADVATLLPPADAVAAIEDALRAGLDPSAGVPRGAVALRSGSMLLMPAESAAHAGVKLVTVAPGNTARGLPTISGLYAIFDAATLRPVAIIDGAALTTLRTPAVSFAAVRRFLPEAPHVVVFGAGPQGAGHLGTLRALVTPASVTVVTRSGPGATRTAEALHAADLVVCATTAREPLFDSALLGDRAVVVAVGSHEPDAREVDAAFCGRATVIVEDRATALRECGDVVLAAAEGILRPGDLLSLSDVVNGAPVPPGPILFKGSGMAWQDLVIAEAVLARPL
ncbi:putative ornithine cyclodeaminase [Actinoplanes missouriensis 431]|uniref:Putative ornithine cyclodeaminase n=1 Tax=Actinoplanes missouriensis (strain ATCC 14538 / DSM 43046 / CBS 188.64 / JCM 3121 / NBRC 102363 / NCIMB 12654 / NRRL B-3342 / UNCC 431) TaxID=512565 RepID=I0H9D3_ACTM4|nr:ornithine cyclodeaminase family protein [Actinoplanes missouriensis]BAL89620.1 putative ornithine cyclodeaminase [Actinoplanes missouriensis 431]